MIDVWTLVRFVHIVGAALWVGGQLTISLAVLPPVRTLLGPDRRVSVLRSVGRRFAVITMAVFLPSQLATGLLLAWHNGVTWQSLTEAGYGRLLLAKLALFALVMVAASVHGIAQGRGRAWLARAAATAALTGSLGVLLLATGLTAG
ncbi:hypothetical protein [Amycolatopsis aidingensis]|uniref:hypothetical protein n=1 Tax=Amycolatopsis aidingensis TaxID=2842453 RepID=UPI001C0C48EC|nr:hypothetical protein [Amycolatopsis aidingensis]